ncbi:MAG: Ribosomal RNA small subunit methyltransferase H [Parcubacteria group bacterium GW2011_GWA2_39_18]|nr:MAG: Ribosomal RNA small subunit methyltransferase H [Parcubacteria group bacterium GW2011_GWA2_39_18]
MQEIKKMEKYHESVLVNEVLQLADLKSDTKIIDVTLDGGGHAQEFLKIISPQGKLLGIEKDPEMLEVAKERLSNFKNIKIAQGSFESIEEIAKENGFLSPDIIFFDLGVSSYHFDKSTRGFSFRRDEDLDMRLDPGQSLTAKEIINNYPEEELEKIFKNFGELRFSYKIASFIVKHRRQHEISSTGQLADVIRAVSPLFNKPGYMAKAFQALRIAVNNELDVLASALPKALKILKGEGRILVISFHSLEDRIVKNFFRNEASLGHLKIITKKPIVPSRNEVIKNKRSRSAKLRAGIKI